MSQDRKRATNKTLMLVLIAIAAVALLFTLSSGLNLFPNDPGQGAVKQLTPPPPPDAPPPDSPPNAPSGPPDAPPSDPPASPPE